MNENWAGSDHSVFFRIGHSSRYEGGQPSYLLARDPNKGSQFNTFIDLKDAFENKVVTISDIKYMEVADILDNGNDGDDNLGLKGAPNPNALTRCRMPNP